MSQPRTVQKPEMVKSTGNAGIEPEPGLFAFEKKEAGWQWIFSPSYDACRPEFTWIRRGSHVAEYRTPKFWALRHWAGLPIEKQEERGLDLNLQPEIQRHSNALTPRPGVYPHAGAGAVCQHSRAQLAIKNSCLSRPDAKYALSQAGDLPRPVQVFPLSGS